MEEQSFFLCVCVHKQGGGVLHRDSMNVSPLL